MTTIRMLACRTCGDFVRLTEVYEGYVEMPRGEYKPRHLQFEGRCGCPHPVVRSTLWEIIEAFERYVKTEFVKDTG